MSENNLFSGYIETGSFPIAISSISITDTIWSFGLKASVSVDDSNKALVNTDKFKMGVIVRLYAKCEDYELNGYEMEMQYFDHIGSNTILELRTPNYSTSPVVYKEKGVLEIMRDFVKFQEDGNGEIIPYIFTAKRKLTDFIQSLLDSCNDYYCIYENALGETHVSLLSDMLNKDTKSIVCLGLYNELKTDYILANGYRLYSQNTDNDCRFRCYYWNGEKVDMMSEKLKGKSYYCNEPEYSFDYPDLICDDHFKRMKNALQERIIIESSNWNSKLIAGNTFDVHLQVQDIQTDYNKKIEITNKQGKYLIESTIRRFSANGIPSITILGGRL